VAVEKVRDRNVFFAAIIAAVEFFLPPQLSGSLRLRHEFSSHMTLTRRPSEPILRNSRGVDIRLGHLNEQVAIPPPCEAPLPNARRNLVLSVDPSGLMRSCHSGHPAIFKSDLSDEHDADRHFPTT